MSQQNVEIVMAMTAAYNSGDLDAMLSLYAVDLEAFPDAAVFPEADPLRGRAEFRAWLDEIASAWVRPSWVTTEVFALSGDRVLHRGDWGGEGVASGIETASSVTGIFTVLDGQISRVDFFFDHDRALKAVGLAQ